jgi:hypothetical protein
MEYFEYFIDNENFILSWQSWNSERIPKNEQERIEYAEKIERIKNNPVPLGRINDTVKDDNGRLWHVKSNKNFKLINNEIQMIDHIENDDEIFNRKYSYKEALRRIVKGIKNGVLDPDFIEFSNDLEKTIRKGVI